MEAGNKELRQQGFTLVELLISVFIFLLIMTITFSLFTSGLRSSRKELIVAYHDEAIKSAMALMMAEIQQAGSHPDTIPTPQLQTSLAAGLQNIYPRTVEGGNPLRGINIGDKITIYDDPTKMIASESVTVINIDQKNKFFRANLTKPHPADSALVSIKQPFRTGILTNSTGDKLKFLGDIFDDGQLYYVEYTYD